MAAQSQALDWHGPGSRARTGRRFSWKMLAWTLVFPPKRHQITPTVPGLFLIVLAMAIGTAAYNTASNILFITLSLLLACLLLSGLMSWFNFMGISWRIRPEGPWRVGHEALVSVDLRNGKKWLPTYGLWFEVIARLPRPAVEDDVKGMRVRDVLAAAEKAVVRGRVHLRDRLDAGAATSLDWISRPAKRGRMQVELASAGSFFPFGFLRKNIGAQLSRAVLVWPAQVDYQWRAPGSPRSTAQGVRTSRAGVGEDLLSLRKYETGDSHRLIHWKASARLRQLMVRQFSAESHDGYFIRLDAPAAVWTRPEQFELLCSFAGSLAEDLFAAGRLRGYSVDGGVAGEVRRLRDLEAFLDALAILQPMGTAAPGSSPAAFRHNLITFAPSGARGVSAHVDGVQTASA